MPMLHKYTNPQVAVVVLIRGKIGTIEHFNVMSLKPCGGGSMAKMDKERFPTVSQFFTLVVRFFELIESNTKSAAGRPVNERKIIET